ncbi:fused MFS/spermidine synthase [Alicyclobacillus tolerans]|uniref:spermidine synthase n=1 Tax=Alicyclobacillus tolerans TaxID=90970 RepID=UPI001F1CA67B|nr:fused MFS/spermidine synthase [Alicyclobacillus tolerans]MCF8563222.1 fused MFS/spermidine synthase [Alicyclobacillus tolerans]
MHSLTDVEPAAKGRIEYTKAFLYSYVTVTGASVMALELAASRFLAPYFGTSMLIWANIIGLILLCLAIGYWIGGRLADRKPDARILMGVSSVAGVWMSLLPVWGDIIFKAMSHGITNTPVAIIVLSLAAILLVFAPPVLLLAMVSPFAIRLANHSLGDIGKVSGNLYAFSTFGSLIGTFGTAFGTIPFWGTRETLFFWSAVLIAASAWGLRTSRFRYVAAAFLLLPAILYIVLHGPVRTGSSVVFAKDTLYQFVQVEKKPDGTTYLIYNEGGGVQSIYRPNNALNPGDYYDDYLVLPYLAHPASSVPTSSFGTRLAPNGSSSVLVLGSAGGTIPHLLSVYDRGAFPRLQITGVEIDPAVIPLDYKYFGLRPSDAHIVNQDARVYLSGSEAKYDAIVIDAYTQQIYIPFHLSTVQFFQQVKDHLSPYGVAALNINAVSADSKLLLAFERTMTSVFPHTYILKARGEYNYVLLGTRLPLQLKNLGQIQANSPLYPVVQEWRQSLQPVSPRAAQAGELLTDNRAPVEMLTDSMILHYARHH